MKMGRKQEIPFQSDEPEHAHERGDVGSAGVQEPAATDSVHELKRRLPRLSKMLDHRTCDDKIVPTPSASVEAVHPLERNARITRVDRLVAVIDDRDVDPAADPLENLPG